MNFSARKMPQEGEKSQLSEPTYITSITTTRRLPENATFKKKEMDFQEMIKCLKKGVRARRLIWKKGGFLWKEGKILVHNTPYWGGEIINQYVDGYPYMAEEEDISANDWIILKEGE